MTQPHDMPPERPPRSKRARVLVCRHCGCSHFYVSYARRLANGDTRRRLDCRHCGNSVYTIERIEVS